MKFIEWHYLLPICITRKAIKGQQRTQNEKANLNEILVKVTALSSFFFAFIHAISMKTYVFVRYLKNSMKNSETDVFSFSE